MHFENLIRKYRKGTLNLHELGEMRRMLNELSFSEVEKAMNNVAADEDPMEVSQEMIDRVKASLDHEISRASEFQTSSDPDFFPDEQSEDTSAPIRKWKLLSTAAMILAVVSLGLSAYYFVRTDRILAASGFTEVSTGFGEKSTITLPDGTVVRMAGRTTLKYPCNFAMGNRNVDFEGEAYFNVSKDRRHPFTVHAGEIDVTVTGTRFNVYSRPGSESDEVILDNGSVSVTSIADNSKVDLKSGESVVFNKVSGEFDIVNFKSLPMQRRRIFGIRYERIEPEALIKALEEKFNVTINSEISSAINSPFTGVLPDDDINENLAILSKIYGFNIPYQREK